MDREEWEDLADCVDCGRSMSPDTDRAFALNDDEFLCYECAVRRGGIYDAGEDRWTLPPDVSDEPDERRPHP